jgi:hypothetical protein
MLTTDQEPSDMNPNKRARDQARWPSWCRQLRAGVLAAAIAANAALVLAGCGGSSTTTSTPTRGTGTVGSSVASQGGYSGAPRPPAGMAADAVKFARCIRSHGVSDFPDPPSSGQLTIPPDDRNTPAFESASKACQSLMPGGAGGAGQRTDMSRAQQLQLAKCMRSHGVPNIPDPDASGGIPLAGINPNSPAVKAALQKCQPAGGPARAP